MIDDQNSIFYHFFRNPVFLSALFSWIIAQFTKTLIAVTFRRVRSLKDLFYFMFWRTGGMPSSHSSLVVSVTTAIGFHSGVNSDVFILACCLSLVVIRDAVGVRRSSGIQARTLNDLGGAVRDKINIAYKPIKVIQGHQPLEVIVGMILGFFIGLAFSVL